MLEMSDATESGPHQSLVSPTDVTGLMLGSDCLVSSDRSLGHCGRRCNSVAIEVAIPVSVLIAFAVLVRYLHALSAPGGAQPADTLGLLQVSAEPPCIKLKVRDVNSASSVLSFSFEISDIPDLQVGKELRLVLTNLRTGIRGQFALWSTEDYEGSQRVGRGSYTPFLDANFTVEAPGAPIAVGDRLSSCADRPFKRQLSTEWGIDSSCLDHNRYFGRNIYMTECSHEASQEWYWDETGERLRTEKDERFCLDYDWGGWTGRNNVRMAKCSETTGQKWYWHGMQLRSKHNGHCLEVSQYGRRNVRAKPCTSSRKQQWFFHLVNAKCKTDVSANRGSSGTQVARRCLPTYDDDQKVSVFFLEVSLGSPGIYHTGLRFRGDCELVNKPFVGYDSAPGAKTVSEFPDGVRAKNSMECFKQCANNCCCNAWVYAKDVGDRPDCFLLQHNRGVGRRNSNRVFGYLQPKAGDACVREVVDYQFGAKDFSSPKGGVLKPNYVNIENGEVRYNEKALEVSFMVSRPCPRYWWWSHSVTNIGQLTGKQMNAFSDWTSVPNTRPDISPVELDDNNYMATARQYNLNGVYSRGPPYDRRHAPIEYIPSTKCDDYVWGALRWMSSNLGVVMNPVRHGEFCYGRGCKGGEIRHSLVGTLVTGSSPPELIGPKAGKECAAFWGLLQETEIKMTKFTSVRDMIGPIKTFVRAFVLEGMALKACVYKDHKWYKTPINLFSGHLPFAWALGTEAPYYHHVPYSCPNLGGCTIYECSARGFGFLGGGKEVCVSKNTYWSAEPQFLPNYEGNVQVLSVSNANFESGGNEKKEEAQSLVISDLDFVVSSVLRMFTSHMSSVIEAVRDTTTDYHYTFHPLLGLVAEASMNQTAGPYSARQELKEVPASIPKSFDK